MKYDRAPIPAVFDGIVTAGTNNFGNFGCTVVVANKTCYQVIYGHLARPLKVRLGQRKTRRNYRVSKQYELSKCQNGQPFAYSVSKYGYINGERNFVCSGINPLTINIAEKSIKQLGCGREYLKLSMLSIFGIFHL